jgi:hypothetical protein
MSSTSNINFAKYSGYDSLAAAIVFSVAYAPLLLVFLKKAFSQPTYVHYVLTLFCAIRVTAFVIRAVMIGVESAGENLNLLIGDQILFAIGYAGLLYSSYTLVLDLGEEAANQSGAYEHPILRLTRNRHLFRITMVLAVVLGIIASSTISSDGTAGPSSTSLREASSYIFLALTALLFLQTLHLARFNPSQSRATYGATSIGAKHGVFILLAVCALLLVREIFIAATISPSQHPKQLNEHYWYPLVALPEILAVFLFVTPGLVPTREELDRSSREKQSASVA